MREELVLHSFRRCPFAIRVRLALEEKGLSYTVLEEDLTNPSPELLALNPDGKVPVLLHSGLVLRESAVITEYLEEIHPSPALMPSTPGGRAAARMWTAWCHESFKPAVDAYKYQGRTEGLEAHLARLNAALERSPFLLGDGLTLADVHVFPFHRQLSRSVPCFEKLKGFPPVQDWLERIQARPAFIRAMARA